jgi:glycosyltransferase involved in cell wall biosynthesis
MMGMYSDTYLAKVYSAGDVLLMPSAGEGFGVPTIEAQACGLPVIVTDATAQAELCGSGWRVRVDEDDRVYTLQNSEQFRVKPSAIVNALKLAYEARGDVSLREYAREFAMMYDADKVWREYMKPAIEAQVVEAQTARAGLAVEREARTRIRKQMRANSEGL